MKAFQLPLFYALVSVTLLGCDQAPSAPPAEDSANQTRSDAGKAEEVASFYSIGHYDEKQDPAADLAQTIQRAQQENKRILLQIGGEWCPWCLRITDFMTTNPQIRSLVENHFVIMKVTYPGDNADAFLANYPKVEAYPHFFVLDQDGQLLHSQGTGELEEGSGYNESVFAEFLNQWTGESTQPTSRS
jgi:thioredoxin-related protein